jgi:hypothetical protein
LASDSGSLFGDFRPQGWVMLTGAVPSIGGAFPDLADHLLERIDPSRPPLGLTGGSGRSQKMEAFMEDLDVLIEVEGVVLALGEETEQHIENAGMIVLAGGKILEWLQAFERGDLEQRLIEFLKMGNLLIAAGTPAAVFGSWTQAEDGSPLKNGLEWIPGAIVMPGIGEPAEIPEVNELLASSERLFALGLPPETALAVGPGGEVEVWSLAAPKLVLGKGWRI